MAGNNEIRWVLLESNQKESSFTVMDHNANRRRVFHVPFLTHVELAGHLAYVRTANSKTMRLNLSTGERKFLLPEELKMLAPSKKSEASPRRRKIQLTELKRVA